MAGGQHWAVLGDALWIVALLVIALVTLRAWRKVPPGARLPMQWGQDWKPAWRARRSVALLFTPLLAVLLGVSLALFLRRAPAGSEVLFFWIRIAPALILVGAHSAHVAFALKHAPERAD